MLTHGVPGKHCTSCLGGDNKEWHRMERYDYGTKRHRAVWNGMAR